MWKPPETFEEFKEGSKWCIVKQRPDDNWLVIFVTIRPRWEMKVMFFNRRAEDISDMWTLKDIWRELEHNNWRIVENLSNEGGS